MNGPSPSATRSECIGYSVHRRPVTFLSAVGLFCAAALVAVQLAAGRTPLDAVIRACLMLVITLIVVALAIVPWDRHSFPRARLDRAEYLARNRESKAVSGGSARSLPPARRDELLARVRREDEGFRRTRPWRIAGLLTMFVVGVAHLILVDPSSGIAMQTGFMAPTWLLIMTVVRSMRSGYRESLEAAVAATRVPVGGPERPGGTAGAERGAADESGLSWPDDARGAPRG